MALFENHNQKSWLAKVEFSPVSNGNVSFFHIRDRARREKVKEWLTSPEVGQEIIAETVVGSRPLLVTRGDKTQEQIMDILAAKGDTLEPFQRKVPFSERAWKTGATLAFIGQGMQLISSGLRPNRKPDWSLRMLAIPNLIATSIIFTYGAQREPDTHQLRFLKTHLNDELDDYLKPGDKLPGIDEDRSSLREEPAPPKTIVQKANGWMKRNSVIFAEIGLRYFGAFCLAFPINKWGKGAELLNKGAFKEAYTATRSPIDRIHYAGLLSLTSKTAFGLPSKGPDPYNPEPPTWLDTAREKYTFPIATMCETAAWTSVAADGLLNKNKKISFTKGGKEYQDYISFIGASLFAIRYVVRFWAPFGVKELDMEEVYAHTSDALAKMPRDKLPQLVAETAADYADHLHDKNIQFGEIFTRIVADLHRYHHIDTFSSLEGGPENRPLAEKAKLPCSQPDSTVQARRVQALSQQPLQLDV